jgi:hypothetical protein
VRSGTEIGGNIGRAALIRKFGFNSRSAATGRNLVVIVGVLQLEEIWSQKKCKNKLYLSPTNALILTLFNLKY